MHDTYTAGVVGKHVARATGVIKPELAQNIPGLLLNFRVIGRARLLIKVSYRGAGKLNIVLKLLALACLHIRGKARNRFIAYALGLFKIVSRQECCEHRSE